MTPLACLSLQLLVLALAAVQALPDPGDVLESSSGRNVVGAKVDAASFSTVQLHEDKDFS
jgi:hypothetical protein